MGGDDELARWRRNIDEVDGRILELLNERFRCVQEIGKHKNDTRRSPYDPARERAVVKRLVELNEGPFPDEAVEHVFREIMSAALALQIPKRIARSEDHTSELQSHSFISYAVFCLKKKNRTKK